MKKSDLETDIKRLQKLVDEQERMLLIIQDLMSSIVSKLQNIKDGTN